MKQLFLVGLLAVGFIFANQEAGKQESTEAHNNQVTEAETEEVFVSQTDKEELAAGIRKVVAIIGELKRIVDNSPDKTEDINKLGKGLAEEWDSVEKQVEDNYPEDYKNIEDSLYPLIAYAQNETPDIEKIKQLIKEVIEKLAVFGEKL